MKNINQEQSLGPNGFMGRTFRKKFTLRNFFVTMHPKKGQTVSKFFFGDKLTTLHLLSAHQRSLQLKSIAISLTHTSKSQDKLSLL